jgi:hypothetical protein
MVENDSAAAVVQVCGALGPPVPDVDHRGGAHLALFCIGNL